MMLGVVRESDELPESSTPNSALVIRPDPCGSGGGASLAARAGLGEGALDDGAVAEPFSFLAAGADGLVVGAGCSFLSTSMASEGCRV